MPFYSWITGTSAEEVVTKPGVIKLAQLKPCHQWQDYPKIRKSASPYGGMKKKESRKAARRSASSNIAAYASASSDKDEMNEVDEEYTEDPDTSMMESQVNDMEFRREYTEDPDTSMMEFQVKDMGFRQEYTEDPDTSMMEFQVNDMEFRRDGAPIPMPRQGVEQLEIRQERLNPDDINALVFQGGGAKGIAYCGVIKELSERGILQKITRFGGASAGAICAAFLALGCSADRIRELLNQDFNEMLMGDHWYDKVLSFIPGQKFLRGIIATIHNYGLYSTASFHDWMGYEFMKQVKEKEKINPSSKRIRDKPNITFKEVYDLFGVELCVIVSNVSTETEEYFHPKTTPEFPVRDAVIISMSIPLLFEPVTRPFYDENEYYVDGGVICNFPVHCFDGWWLSMDPEDAFPQKFEGNFQTICSDLRTSRFENTNRDPRTLGFRVVTKKTKKTKTTPTEAESIEVSGTKLARKYNERIEAKNKGLDTVRDIDELLNALRTGVVQADHTMVSRDTILNCLSKAPELKQKLEMEQREGDIRFTFRDLESAIYEITKRSLAEWMTDNPKKKICGLFDFVHSLTNLLDVTPKADHVYRDYHECNEWRTITIETKYIGTTDFKMEDEDKKFLIKQGEDATRIFFNSLTQD